MSLKRDLNESVVAQLRERKMIDANNCPEVTAYAIALGTVSSDFSPLCTALFDHAESCATCQERLKMAIEMTKS